jgi:hypothetical protein
MEERPLCDLVMKGGVTSGIVYPRLASRLARDFQFKNIGGTSAGAIAAAACAAAEYGRQSGRNPHAFSLLEELPDELGRPVDGLSGMLRLFQPALSLRRHFKLALAIIGARDKAQAVVAGLLGLASKPVLAALTLGALLFAAGVATALTPAQVVLSAIGALAAFLAGAVLGFTLVRRSAAALPARLGAAAFIAAVALGVFDVWYATDDAIALLLLQLPGIAIAAVLALVAGIKGFATSLLRGLGENCYGICSGRTTAPEQGDGLTEWLGGYLNQLAGLDPARPLTYRDLWGEAPAGANVDKDEALPAHLRAINLEMITTAVSQHTPYAIPFRRGSGNFYFRAEEWALLFPPVVMDWLLKVSPAAERTLDCGKRVRLHRLPRTGELPVIVGVRMSLSFPFLLSAVPMYASDRSDRRPDDGIPKTKRVWFSDGGISTNLPLHFFDELLPSHPTFAINLKEEHPSHPVDDAGPCGDNGRVYLPASNKAGSIRYWTAGEEGSPRGLLQFGHAIFETMQRWRDEILFPYPGYRDRIVQVSLRPDEGGLNLAMSERQIGVLAGAGACAGELVYKRFHPREGAEGWRNHQRIRVLSMLGNLERLAQQAQRAKAGGQWSAAIDGLKDTRYNHTQAALAQQLLADLENMGARVEASGVSLHDAMMKPRAIMRLGPQI